MTLFTRMIPFVGFITILLMLTSCTSTEDLEAERANEHQTFAIGQLSMEGDMLVFSSPEELNRAVAGIENTTEKDYESWVESQAFTSMWSRFNDFFDFSVASAEKGYGKSLGELRVEYGNSVVIEEDGTFELNCFDGNYAKLVNSEGLLKVGEAIYKFTKEKYIVIIDGDLSKIEDGLRLQQSSNELGIEVYSVENPNEFGRQQCASLNYSGNNSTASTTVFFNEWCFRLPTTNPPRNCNFKLRVDITNSQSRSVERLNVRIKGYQRGAFGIWYGYNSLKTVTSTSSTVQGQDPITGTIAQITNNFFGTSGNDNLLTFDIVNNEEDIPNAFIIEPRFVDPNDGYNQACVSFNIEFFTQFGMQFIQI